MPIYEQSVNVRKVLYDPIPAGLRVAQPCRYCFYSVVQKWVFRLAWATRCPDKREIWHWGAANFTFNGAEMWNTAPKTVKISNFGDKFSSQG